MFKNDQQLFDLVAEHLLTQKAKSFLRSSVRFPGNPDGNAYRGENGMKCAIGCVIPDEMYSSKLEGWSIFTTQFERIFRKVLGNNIHEDLPYVLQRVHDLYPVEAWIMKLSEVALDFDLSLAIIDKYELA
jgi:hypothetical protein